MSVQPVPIPSVPPLDGRSQKFLRSLKSIVERYEGVTGPSGEMVVKRSDLIDQDFRLQYGIGTSTEITESSPGYHPGADPTKSYGPIPDPPTDLILIKDDTTSGINPPFSHTLTWTNPDDEDAWYIEVWVNTEDSLSGAELIGIVTLPTNTFVNYSVNFNLDHYYWIRSVSYGNKYSTWEPDPDVGGKLVQATGALKDTIDGVLDALRGEQPVAYSASITYYTGNYCLGADGKPYKAKQETTGNAPPNATYWQCMEWDSGTTWVVGDRVTHVVSGYERIYRCLVEHSNQEPPNSTYWERAGVLMIGDVDSESVVGIDGNLVVDGTILSNAIYTGAITVGKLDGGVTDRMFTSSTEQTNIEGWIASGDVTKIDGGKIYTNTIVASSIKGNAFGQLTLTSGSIKIETSSGLVIDGGGDLSVYNGDINIYSAGSLNLTGGGGILIDDGGILTLDDGGLIQVKLGGMIHMYGGGGILFDGDDSDYAPLLFEGSNYSHQVYADSNGVVYWKIMGDTYLPNTATKSPSTTANAGSGQDWTNHAYVKTDDSNWATCTGVDGYSKHLRATNYGFSRTSSDTIIGIEVLVTLKSDDYVTTIGGEPAIYFVKENEVRLCKAGSETGDNKSAGNIWPTSEVTIQYGGPSDLWGTTWSYTDINNSGFGASIKAELQHTNNVAYIDHIEIKVYYRTDTGATYVQHLKMGGTYVDMGYVDQSTGGRVSVFHDSVSTYSLNGCVYLVPGDNANSRILCEGDLDPNSAGTYDMGDSTDYWNEINYKTLTDRGCLGWFDGGVELQDGRKVSDIEALLAIRVDETKQTVYGVPMLDYKTMPKAVYKRASKNGEDLPRDENDEPYDLRLNETGEYEIVPAADGAEMSALISIMLGAIKELHHRTKSMIVYEY